MTTDDPRARTPEPAEPEPESDELTVQLIHHKLDKADKDFYALDDIVRALLDKNIFGKVLPPEIVARLDTARITKKQTEVRDLRQDVLRRVDLLIKIRFRDSSLYLALLLEAQSRVDWRMPLRILQATALVYGSFLDEPEYKEHGKLPLVVPVVVYTGRPEWTAPTSVTDMLPDEAKVLLPYVLGQQFVLVEEAKEAAALGGLETLRDAALRLRYHRNYDQYSEAAAKFRELLPESVLTARTEEVIMRWVRAWMTRDGEKEERVAKLQRLEDLERPVHETWWQKDIREAREEGVQLGQRSTLVRQARRKFGEETAEELAALLEGVSAPERLDRVLDLIIDCATGSELLAQLMD